MDLGRSVGGGTHAGLMDRGGLYDDCSTMRWKGQGDLATWRLMPGWKPILFVADQESCPAPYRESG